MKLPSFLRGVHPPENKQFTENCAIEDLRPTGSLVFPMAQHLGAPAKPIVAKGDRVCVGQILGEPQGFVSAPIMSSVSGTVTAVAPVMTIAGVPVMAVTVESDGTDEEVEGLESRNLESLSADNIKNIVKASGIVGMGGACFPTFIKLAPPEGTKIDHLIVNAAECEPFLTCDYRLILEDCEPILDGIRALLAIFPEAHLTVGIEANKPEAAKLMKQHLEHIERASVVVLATKYPQGGEKQLIYAVTGREVPAGKLPADAGAIVCNTLTTYDIGYALKHGRASLKRIITVAGDAIARPGNYRVPLGINVREVIDAAGGFVTPPMKMLAGGPMMGMTMSNLDVPVVKGTSGLLALTDKVIQNRRETACIRCARCIKGCPMGLLPTTLDAQVRRRDYEGFRLTGGMNCIECGVCSYVCPAARFLTQSCKEGKKYVMAAMRKKG